MHALLLLTLLSQAPTQTGGVVVSPQVPARSFSDGERQYTVYESQRFVAEAAPSDEFAKQLRALDPQATVKLSKPTMRIWQVSNPAKLRVALPALKPVFHDLSNGSGRMRVPVGLVCGGQKQSPASWEEVFSRSGSECLPDFWYPPHVR